MIFRENTHQNCSFDLHSGGKMASMVDAHLNCICASTFNLIKFAPSADALSKIILKRKKFDPVFYRVCKLVLLVIQLCVFHVAIEWNPITTKHHCAWHK